MHFMLWIVTFLGLYLIKYFLENHRFYKLAFQYQRDAPGIPNIFLGYVQMVLNKCDIYQTFRNMNKGCGHPAFTCLWLPRLSVVVKKVEYLHTFLASKDTIDKSQHYVGIRYFMGAYNDGLASANGDDFIACKKRFLQTFNNAPVNLIFDSFLRGVGLLKRDLEQKAGNGYFEMMSVANRVTTRNIIDGAMDQQIADDCPLMKMTEGGFDRIELNCIGRGITSELPLLGNLFPFKRNLAKLQSELHGQWKQMYNQKKSEYLALNKNVPNQYIYNLIREEEMDPTLDICAEITTMFLGAVGTTASVTSACLVMLGMHLDMQERVYQETLQVEKELNGRVMTDNDLEKYKYLHRVVKETLRLFPPVPLFARQIKEEVKLGDHILPKGSEGILYLPYIHRDPDTYPDPTKFNPDRFLPEEVEKRHKLAHIPFSYGPRQCPGMRHGTQSTVFIVSTVIRHYKVFSKYKTVEELDKNLRSYVTLFEVKGYPIRLEKRN